MLSFSCLQVAILAILLFFMIPYTAATIILTWFAVFKTTFMCEISMMKLKIFINVNLHNEWGESLRGLVLVKCYLHSFSYYLLTLSGYYSIFLFSSMS